MQKLAGTREGTEQFGAAIVDGTHERRPVQPRDILNITYATKYNINQFGGVALQLQDSKLLKAFRNVNVYQLKARDEDRLSGGEPK